MPAATETVTLQATAITVPPHLRRLVLTGFMGAGKSTIGRLLALQLGWDFLDLDAHLEARTGSTIAALFAERGEAQFRRLESLALASALGRSGTVLALGGGTPELLTNRLLIEQTPATATMFLDAPFETLFDRCVLQESGELQPGTSTPVLSRPVLADPDQARARFAVRRPLYRRLAHVSLQTDAMTAHETVHALLQAVEKMRPPLR